MKTTGAKAIVQALTTLGARRVFGLPSIQNMELFDAFLDAPFETILVTHEGSAAFMADVHARVTGELGILCVSPGPGITNCITALAEAQLDSSPVLGIVAAPGASQGMAFRLHDIDQKAVAAPVVKGVFSPKSVREISGLIAQAASLAQTGEPGPVIVEVSTDLLMATEDILTTAHNAETVGNDIEQELDSAAELLKRSRSVGIYVGFGAVKASESLRKLAQLLDAPVATTLSGRGAIPEDHPLSVGAGFGASAMPVARKLFGHIDTLLSIGCKYGEVSTGGYGIRIPQTHIHIDINKASLERNYPTTLAIAGDAEHAIAGLLVRLQDHARATRPAHLQRIQLAKDRDEKAATSMTDARMVSPPKFLRALRNTLDRDAIIVTDCGNHQFWAISDFPVYVPRSFITPADFQAMGFSIPGAIAAKLAFPQRQVISLIGDGGFLMSGFELLTAVRQHIKIMVVVFRDGALGMIKDAQQAGYGRTGCVALQNPDYRQLALALGIDYVSLCSDNDIAAGLRQMLESAQSVLVDVHVNYATPTRYFKGAASTIFRRLPLGTQMRVAFRLFRNRLFSTMGRQI